MSKLDVQQILLPKKVYIGDTAELRCTFNSNSLALKNLVDSGAVHLSHAAFTTPIDMQNYDIKEITLSAAGVEYYQLSIIFVPWKTGTFVFPNYDLMSNFTDATLSPSDLNENTFVQFETVNIVSITEQDSITSLRPQASPLLLPGTTYKIYAGILILLFLLILIIRSILRYEEIGFYIRNKKLLRKYKKNRRKTEKSLLALLNSSAQGKEFSQNFQQILRSYLEVRFNQPFTKITSSEFMKVFNAAFGGTEDFSSLMSERTENACIQITSLFTRTDFIRYSQNAVLSEEEKNSLVDSAKKCISDFEEPEKEARAGEEKNV